VSNVEDLRREVRQVQDELERPGEAVAALELCKALGDYYNTSTEALIGLVDALGQTSTSWHRLSAQRVRQIDAVMRDAKALMNLA
jgi:hypothetical protein